MDRYEKFFLAKKMIEEFDINIFPDHLVEKISRWMHQYETYNTGSGKQ